MTLVELLIAFLLLAIICVGWLQIIGIQSAKREARRREAVERLSGMMDAFMCSGYTAVRSYLVNAGTGQVSIDRSNGRTVVFDGDISPICYRLHVATTENLENHEEFSGWNSADRWLVGELYDSGTKESPFFSLQVRLAHHPE